MSQALIASMQRETQAIAAFVEALQQERTAIRAGDFQSLGDLVQNKQELAQQIAQLGTARQAQMAALGIRVGSGRQLVGLHIDEGVANAWRTLVLTARGAAEANTLNGAVVSAHLEYTKDALQTLRQRGDTATVYGRNGRAQTGPRGVSLASG